MEENLVKMMKDLKFELEDTLNTTIESQPSYKEVVKAVKAATGIQINPRTVDRAFSYNGKTTEPSLDTRNLLVRILGFDSWQDYKNRGYNVCEQDTLFNPENVKVEYLKKGEYVVLGWRPIYFCVVEYLGNKIFKIVKVKNMSLKIGSTFKAVRFDVASMPQPASGSFPTYGYRLYPSILAYQDESIFYELEDCCNVEVL